MLPLRRPTEAPPPTPRTRAPVLPCSYHARPLPSARPPAPLPLQELVVSPSLLQAHNIPVVRVEQHPGEFVVTYPGA